MIYLDKEAIEYEADTANDAADQAYGPGSHYGRSMWSWDQGWTQHVLGSGGADIAVEVSNLPAAIQAAIQEDQWDGDDDVENGSRFLRA
jgi:hypothetical protein